MEKIIKFSGILAVFSMFVMPESCLFASYKSGERDIEELRKCPCVREYIDLVMNGEGQSTSAASAKAKSSAKKKKNKKNKSATKRAALNSSTDDSDYDDEEADTSSRKSATKQTKQKKKQSKKQSSKSKTKKKRKSSSSSKDSVNSDWANTIAFNNMNDCFKKMTLSAMNVAENGSDAEQNDKDMSSIMNNNSDNNTLKKGKLKARYRINEQEFQEFRKELERFRQLLA